MTTLTHSVKWPAEALEIARAESIWMPQPGTRLEFIADQDNELTLDELSELRKRGWHTPDARLHMTNLGSYSFTSVHAPLQGDFRAQQELWKRLDSMLLWAALEKEFWLNMRHQASTEKLATLYAEQAERL